MKLCHFQPGFWRRDFGISDGYIGLGSRLGFRLKPGQGFWHCLLGWHWLISLKKVLDVHTISTYVLYQDNGGGQEGYM